jgi:hypothetical protein
VVKTTLLLYREGKTRFFFVWPLQWYTVWFGVFLSEAGLDLTAADGGKGGTAGLISSLSSAL